MARAEAAYRTVLSQSKNKADAEFRPMLSAICYLYLAEIEVQFNKQPGKAAAILNELLKLPKPNDQNGDLVLEVSVGAQKQPVIGA